MLRSRTLSCSTIAATACLLAAPASAEPAAQEVTGRLLVGWQWGGDSVAGSTARLQLFRHVTGDGRPQFYDLGGEVAWEGAGLRLSFGTRHKMYVVRDSRFEQQVLVGLRWPWSGSGLRFDVTGSFGAEHRPGDARLGAGLHALWHLGTPIRQLALERALGAGVSGSWLRP